MMTTLPALFNAVDSLRRLRVVFSAQETARRLFVISTLLDALVALEEIGVDISDIPCFSLTSKRSEFNDVLGRIYLKLEDVFPFVLVDPSYEVGAENIWELRVPVVFVANGGFVYYEDVIDAVLSCNPGAMEETGYSDMEVFVILTLGYELIFNLIYQSTGFGQLETAWRFWRGRFEWDVDDIPLTWHGGRLDNKRLVDNLKAAGLEEWALVFAVIAHDTGCVLLDMDESVDEDVSFPLSREGILSLRQVWVTARQIIDVYHGAASQWEQDKTLPARLVAVINQSIER